MKNVFALLAVFCLIFSLCSCSESTTTDFEKEAKNYYETLKEKESISKLNSVACMVVKIYDGAEDKDGHIAYGYSFIFDDDKYAYFEDGRYLGGWNSTSAGKDFVKNLDDSDKLEVFSAHSCHYMLLHDDTSSIHDLKISRKEASKGDKEGIFELDVKKIK